MPFGPAPRTDIAPLRNREPATAPATFTSAVDESLRIVAGSALDMHSWCATATPAGSRGRITAVGDKLHEAGVAVRFHVYTIQFDGGYTLMPSDKSVLDAAALNLSRRGYNAVRLMGIEHFVMMGMTGAAAFNSDYLERFDYFLSRCKEYGLYWVGLVMSYNAFEDMQGAINRFTYTAASSCKPRIYTEQGVRDNWRLGVSRLFNRVNRYTGVNMLQDPAMVLFETYNEQSTMLCTAHEFPPPWVTRTAGATPAAKTWGEWLSDPAQAHGYANLAALNASWGSAHATYADAANSAMDALTATVPQTQKNLDGVLYCHYLEDDLTAWYSAAMASLGYVGLTNSHTMYSSMTEARATQKYAINAIGNWHNYFNIAYTPLITGQATTDPDNPIWEGERVATASCLSSGSKASWLGEGGNHSYARWRHQWPIQVAAAASQGASATAWFMPNDPFTFDYSNDTSGHGQLVRRLDGYCSLGAHVDEFVRVLNMAIVIRGDVTELPVSQALVLNNRHIGLSPRNTGRLQRVYSTLLQPLQFLTVLCKARLAWTDDTSDDTLASVWGLKDWYTLLQDMLAAGAIAADHPSLVSAAANHGAIASVATTGTVGGLVASDTQPVLDIGSNTLVDGDLINVTNLTGSVGTWPGIGGRNSRSAVRKGTGTYVRLEADATRNVSGISLAGLSGANFTAGTWCESANVLESGHRQWGMSRRLRRCFINRPRTVFFGHTNATLPATVGAMIVQVLSQNCSVYVTSWDGNSIDTSSRLIIGMCGEAISAGMAYTVGADGKQSLTAVGDYPVKQLDATATLSLGLTLPQSWTLYRLQRNGVRSSAESPASVDAAGSRLIVTLRTGTVYPAVLWELVR